MAKPDDSREEHLYKRASVIIDVARNEVSRTVNTAMVQAYWLIGREIVEVEQLGAKRAKYGQQLISLTWEGVEELRRLGLTE